MPKKPAKKKAPKRKTAGRPKRHPKEDFSQAAYRALQETIRISES